jgi:diadenosine tetraphosphate (Ap4A) HIT family hydrolase
VSASPAPATDPVAFSRRHRPLFTTERWGVLLHRDQTYLGRSLVYLRTRALEDPLELTPEEREELWLVTLPRLAAALDRAFAPDRLNYAHLANRKHHVHWHVVPRYVTEPRKRFAGRTFKDRRPGRMFHSSKRGAVGKRTLEAIAEHVRAQLPA